MKFFVIPGFETFKIDFCKAVAGDPELIGERNFTQDTQWLMIGQASSSSSQMSQVEANQLVRQTHKELSKDYKTVKNWADVHPCNPVLVEEILK